MFLQYYNLMVGFLKENVVLIGLLMAIVQWVKEQVKTQSWYKSWMATVFAFVASFVLAIPAQGISDIPQYIVHSIGLGLVATGLYKVGDGIATKLQ